MTTSLTLDDLASIEFPPHWDRTEILRPLNTESWRRSRRKRLELTYDSPLRFALTYMPHRLQHPDTGGISFIQMHLDMCVRGRGWMDPGEQLCSFVGPRGSGKTTWPFQILPPWALGHGHSSNFLAFSYTAQQARNTHLKNLLNELKTNELLRYDFPGLIPKRGQSSIDRIVLENGATLAAFGMMETSLGWQDVQGRRPRIAVGDDLEPPEAKNSLDEVEKNRSRLLHGVIPMGNHRAVIWVTGTTTMNESLIHKFVHAAKGRPEGDWVRRAGFIPHHYPALDENDESWWPQQWSTETLRAMRDADPYGFDLNYQNDPRPPSEQAFWTPGLFRYDPHWTAADRVLHVDLAESTGPNSDYTAMALVSRKGSAACLERGDYGRWTDPEIRERIHDFCAPFGRHKPHVRAEGKPNRVDSLAPWPEGVTYEMVHATDPKPARIRRGHAQYYRRAVWHLYKPGESEEFDRYIAELCRYPRGKHDDVPDSLSGALEWAFPIKT
jgi:hypothetical protein